MKGCRAIIHPSILKYAMRVTSNIESIEMRSRKVNMIPYKYFTINDPYDYNQFLRLKIRIDYFS